MLLAKQENDFYASDWQRLTFRSVVNLHKKRQSQQAPTKIILFVGIFVFL